MLKVCIIGESGHFPLATNRAVESKNFVITAVADGSEKTGCENVLAHTRKANPDARKYTDYIEMLNAEKPDIAVVNPYLTYNAKVSIDCLNRGIHVFCEKPAVTALDDLNKVKDAWQKNGVLFSVMLASRFAPAVVAAKEFITEGGIGDLRLINTQKSYKLGNRSAMYRNKEFYGGTIPWVGSHAIGWINHFAQKKFLTVFAAQSCMENNGHGDMEVTAACNFTLEDEIIATASIDCLRPSAAATHGDDRIRAVGTKGIVEVCGGEAFVIDDSGERVLPLAPQKHIFDEFIKAVRGEANVLPSVDESFYITEICLKARMSAESGVLVKI